MINIKKLLQIGTLFLTLSIFNYGYALPGSACTGKVSYRDAQNHKAGTVLMMSMPYSSKKVAVTFPRNISFMQLKPGHQFYAHGEVHQIVSINKTNSGYVIQGKSLGPKATHTTINHK